MTDDLESELEIHIPSQARSTGREFSVTERRSGHVAWEDVKKDMRKKFGVPDGVDLVEWIMNQEARGSEPEK